MLIKLACELLAKLRNAPNLYLFKNVDSSIYAQIREETSPNIDSPCVSLLICKVQ